MSSLSPLHRNSYTYTSGLTATYNHRGSDRMGFQRRQMHHRYGLQLHQLQENTSGHMISTKGLCLPTPPPTRSSHTHTQFLIMFTQQLEDQSGCQIRFFIKFSSPNLIGSLTGFFNWQRSCSLPS